MRVVLGRCRVDGGEAGGLRVVLGRCRVDRREDRMVGDETQYQFFDRFRIIDHNDMIGTRHRDQVCARHMMLDILRVFDSKDSIVFVDGHPDRLVHRFQHLNAVVAGDAAVDQHPGAQGSMLSVGEQAQRLDIAGTAEGLHIGVQQAAALAGQEFEQLAGRIQRPGRIASDPGRQARRLHGCIQQHIALA